MANYVIYGTEIPYTGRVLKVNDNFFGTQSGVLEGDSPRLTEITSEKGKFGNDLSKLQTTSQPTTTPTSANNNPVTRTFISRVPYYGQDGRQYDPPQNLHQHADGTIMLGHDPNNMGEIVSPNPQFSAPNGMGNTTTNGTRRVQRTATTTTTPQTGGRMGGGGSY